MDVRSFNSQHELWQVLLRGQGTLQDGSKGAVASSGHQLSVRLLVTSISYRMWSHPLKLWLSALPHRYGSTLNQTMAGSQGTLQDGWKVWWRVADMNCQVVCWSLPSHIESVYIHKVTKPSILPHRYANLLPILLHTQVLYRQKPGM